MGGSGQGRAVMLVATEKKKPKTQTCVNMHVNREGKQQATNVCLLEQLVAKVLE